VHAAQGRADKKNHFDEKVVAIVLLHFSRQRVAKLPRFVGSTIACDRRGEGGIALPIVTRPEEMDRKSEFLPRRVVKRATPCPVLISRSFMALARRLGAPPTPIDIRRRGRRHSS
jgi:hypothetical protein